MALIKPGSRARFIDGPTVQLNGLKFHGSGAKRFGKLQILLPTLPEQKAALVAVP